MKNLLYLINSIVFSTMLIACSNSKTKLKLDNQSSVEKNHIDIEIQNVDTFKYYQQTVLTYELGKTDDTINENAKISKKEAKEAPKHHSPNQTEIDSIKKAKEVLKGGNK